MATDYMSLWESILDQNYNYYLNSPSKRLIVFKAWMQANRLWQGEWIMRRPTSSMHEAHN